MKKPHLLIVRGISPVLDDYKIFAKVLHPLIKFDKKYDSEVNEPIQQTILKISSIFVQKLCLDHPKNDPHQFSRRVRIRRS